MVWSLAINDYLNAVIGLAASLPAVAMVTPVIMLVRWKNGSVFGEGLLAAFGEANGAKWHSFRFLLSVSNPGD